MKISIIIPVYNDEKYLGRSIESALNQNFPKNKFEVIIVNDGSTDLTLEVIKIFGKQIRLIDQPNNEGPIAAANAGFRAACGEYLVKLDSDDFFERDLLQIESNVLDQMPQVNFVYSDYYEAYQGRKKVVKVDGNIFKTVAIGTMFRRTIFESTGFYNDVFFAEYELFLRNPSWIGFYIPKPLFTYFRRMKSLTGDVSRVYASLNELKKRFPEQIDKIEGIRSYLLTHI